jgi:4-hydroxybenzoate polyprenyltransferase
MILTTEALFNIAAAFYLTTGLLSGGIYFYSNRKFIKRYPVSGVLTTGVIVTLWPLIGALGITMGVVEALKK